MRSMVEGAATASMRGTSSRHRATKAGAAAAPSTAFGGPPPPRSGGGSHTPIDRAETFVAALADAPIESFVANLTTVLSTVRCGNATLPCSRNDASTCYVCSPSVAYVDYAAEELRMLRGGAALRIALRPLLALGRSLIKLAGLDRQVQLNNWLLSTNPSPDATPEDILATIADLADAHPDRAITLRSLNEGSDGPTIAALITAGCLMIPARMVYLFDCRHAPPRPHQNERRDALALARTRYAVVPGHTFDAADLARARDLYAMLYLDKYTPLNPQYTALFLERMAAAGLLELHGLRAPCGRLDGIIGFFDAGDVMTAPIVGYDTRLDQRVGLYRLLMAIGFSRARRRRMLFNISAGAGSFKRLRGAVPALEYTAVWNAHLPAYRRLAARTLAWLLEGIAVPLLRKLRL